MSPIAIDSGRDCQVMGVDRGDDHEAHDVVDDREREDEAAQSFGSVPAKESEQAEGEGSIGRHRHAPTVRRGPTSVDGQVEPDRPHHPTESREHGKDDSGTLSKLADVEFPACLEPDDQEEEAHEATVDPATQIHGHCCLTDVYGQPGLPHVVVGGRVGIRPDQRADCSPEEEGGARRLRLQETAKGGVALVTTPYEWSSRKGR